LAESHRRYARAVRRPSGEEYSHVISPVGSTSITRPLGGWFTCVMSAFPFGNRWHEVGPLQSNFHNSFALSMSAFRSYSTTRLNSHTMIFSSPVASIDWY